jgi:hypothetical protein
MWAISPDFTVHAFSIHKEGINSKVVCIASVLFFMEFMSSVKELQSSA